MARQAAGSLPIPFNVTAALVELSTKGPAKIHLNEAVSVLAQVKLAKVFAAGDPVAVGDVEDLAEITPCGISPDAGYALFLRINDRFWIKFDFRYNKAKAKATLGKAREYLETANRALEFGSFTAAVDAAWAAAELMVKTELLMCPARDVEDANTHGSLLAGLAPFARQNEWHKEIGRLTRKLYERRNRHRYSYEAPTIDEMDWIRSSVDALTRLDTRFEDFTFEAVTPLPRSSPETQHLQNDT